MFSVKIYLFLAELPTQPVLQLLDLVFNHFLSLGIRSTHMFNVHRRKLNKVVVCRLYAFNKLEYIQLL